MKTVKHYSVEAVVTKDAVEILNRTIPFTFDDMTELGLKKYAFVSRQELTFAINDDWNQNKSLEFIVALEKKIIEAAEQLNN